MEKDYRKYYWLEEYLFSQVKDNFQRDHHINSFDFFCIIIWKANRVKTIMADKIKKTGKKNIGTEELEKVCKTVSKEIFEKRDNPKEQLRCLLVRWEFGLPMATAILTILYPEVFTVYDIRVCDTFPEFKKLNNLSASKTELKIDKYFEFVKCVKERKEYSIPEMSLRDKDRFLWGRSFCTDLKRDIERGFPKKEKKEQKQT